MATKPFNTKLLILTIAFAVVLATTKYYGSWPKNYESRTAEEKMTYLWTQINKDHSTGSFPNPIGLMKFVGPTFLGGLNLMTPGERVSDQFEDGRMKVIHSVGLVAKARFNWDKAAVAKLGLTGGFTESPDMLLRMSSGSDPTVGVVANFALKHLRKGAPSGNIFGAYSLKAQKTANMFQNPLANHVTNNYFSLSKDGLQAAFLNLVFKKGPTYSGYTGMAEFAQYTSDGTKAKNVKAPFTLVYSPKPDVQTECKNVPLDGKNFGCLKNLKAGRILYTVWGVMEPKLKVTQADVIYLGTLELRSQFVSSKFGDKKLHFKHTFQPEDMTIMKTDWASKINTGVFMDTEGAEKYRQFVKGKDLRRRRLNKQK